MKKYFFAIFFCFLFIMFCSCDKTSGGNILNNEGGMLTMPDKNAGGSATVSPSDIEIGIVDRTTFDDGVAFITYVLQNKESREVYESNRIAIDTEGKFLFDVSEIGSSAPFNSGVMIIEDTIYDKRGKIVASPQISGYDRLLSDNHYELILACKTEESFSGDKYYVGVLNNKGEWVIPLSTEHPIAKTFGKDPYISSDGYIGNNIIKMFALNSIWYYNLSTNELTSDYVRFEGEYYQGKEPGIYKYDMSGNKKLIIPNDSFLHVDRVFENSFFCYHGDNERKYFLYDYDGKLLVDYSKYNISKIISYSEKYLLCLIKNPTGTEYLSLLDANNELCFEPIRIEDTRNTDIYGLYEDGFVVEYSNYPASKYYYYDFSGNCVQYDEKITRVYSSFTNKEKFNNGIGLAYHEDRGYIYINYKGEEILSSDDLYISLGLNK